MEEWKELKIDNLPPDILTGGYEMARQTPGGEYELSIHWPGNKLRVLEVALTSFRSPHYFYRKRQPEAPSQRAQLEKLYMVAVKAVYHVGAANYKSREDEAIGTLRETYEELLSESADIPPGGITCNSPSKNNRTLSR